MEDKEYKLANKLSQAINGFMKGSVLFRAVEGCKYQIKFHAASSKITVAYKYANSALNGTVEGAKGAGAWITRVDTPHQWADYNHININPRVSHRPDPHLPLPPGGVTALHGTARFCQLMNQINQAVLMCVVAVDTIQTGKAIYEDYQEGTTDKTVTTIARIVGGWGFGYAGAKTGAAVGSVFFPGLGTIAGGMIGAIGGGIYGTMGGRYIAEAINNGCRCPNCPLHKD